MCRSFTLGEIETNPLLDKTKNESQKQYSKEQIYTRQEKQYSKEQIYTRQEKQYSKEQIYTRQETN